jgi:molecular chaperone GrpE
MSSFDPLALTEQPVSLPDGLEEFELLPAIQKLYSRTGKLQNLLEAERRRTAKQSEKELLDLLEVVDALDRVLQFMGTCREGVTSTEQLIDAISTTRELLMQKLGKRGVQRVVLLGKPADPRIADVVDSQEKPGYVAGEIVAEAVAAYTLGEVVLRRAQVIVNR